MDVAMTEKSLVEKVESLAERYVTNSQGNKEWEITGKGLDTRGVFLRFNGHLNMNVIPEDIEVVSVDNYSELDVKIHLVEK